ncbi:unnamed protein product [Paramecium pentaurelia]|uniref:Uncharacterized protein n=1 Tax=Paramecium pentaurelia TaxID=43138 RepID=A0A8S1Y915_9CILI|nr:unnamed protein product [Paramecium pentaurelia]
MKIGRWIESSDGFYNQSQVTYHGAYVNDKKFSRWDIFFKGEYEEEFKKMQNLIINIIQKYFSVCGQYAEEGNEIRVGRWTELSNGFKDDSQVTQKRRIFKLQKSWQI